MYKILFFGIGALVGVSVEGFFLGLVLGAGGFLLGIFADNKSRHGESPKGLNPTPTATQPTPVPGIGPATSTAAAPRNELTALRQEVAALKLQVEYLTLKVNAIAAHGTAPLDAQALAAMPPVDIEELTAQALAQPLQSAPTQQASAPAVGSTPAIPAITAATSAPSIRVETPVPQTPVAPKTVELPPIKAQPADLPPLKDQVASDAAKAPAHAPVAATTPAANPTPATTSAPARPQPPRATPIEPEGNLLTAAWNWLFGGNTLVRVGVVVLFFGLAFLVKYAAENMVFPVELRYLGVATGALVAMIIGWRLREKRPGYAMAMQGFAVAVLYLTVFAAFRLHHLLPGSLTFALLLGVCVFSAAIAILQNAVSLAVIGISGGFLAPVLASTGGGSHVALFSYFALLNAGIFAIAWFKAWRPLNVLGFLFTFGIGSAWGQRYYRDELFSTTEPFLILFFAFYLAIALLYARRRQQEMSKHGSLTIGGQQVDYVDGTLVFGAPIAAFGLQYLMVRDMHLGTALSALGLGAIYLPLATWLASRAREEMKLMTESFLALGLIFASLAIPLAFDAQWTAASWALEGVGLYWVAVRQRRAWVRAFALLLQAGGGISMLSALSAPGSKAGWFGGDLTMVDGPALSAAMVGAAGLALAYLIRRYQDQVSETERGLRALLVLWGLAFLHLMFPMVLDQRWTAFAFTVTGCAAVVIGLRRREYGAMVFGLIVQVVGGLMFGSGHFDPNSRAFLNLHWAGCLLIAVAGLVSAVALRWAKEAKADRTVLTDAREFMLPLAFAGLLWSMVWWCAGVLFEIELHAGLYTLAAQIGLAALTAALLLLIARGLRFEEARPPAMALLPVLGWLAYTASLTQAHPAAALGWLAWPAALVMLGVVLRRNEDGPLDGTLPASHLLSTWLAAGLLTWQTWWWFSELGEPGSAWPVLGWALAPIAVLLVVGALARRGLWPLSRFESTYRLATAPIAAGLWFWVFFANLASRGDAAPLPYLPIVNPLDLAVAASIVILFIWAKNLLAATARDGDETWRQLTAIATGTTTFFWLNGALLRTLHHWAGIPFNFDVMMASTLVQAALSLFWAVIALCLMLFATRRGLRLFWMLGGALMTAVVVKLFLVDLSRVGTVERIVSFIGVGILLLVLGYFSPVPPRRGERS